jgi:hypothetical protein
MTVLEPEAARELAHELVVDSGADLGQLAKDALAVNFEQVEPWPEWQASLKREDLVALGEVLAATGDLIASLTDHQAPWVKKKLREAVEAELLGALHEGMGGYFG